MNNKRSIFEEVETGKATAAGPKGGLIDSGKLDLDAPGDSARVRDLARNVQ